MHNFFSKIFYTSELDLIEFQFLGFFPSSGFENLEIGFFSGSGLENRQKLVEFSGSGKLDQALIQSLLIPTTFGYTTKLF